MAFFPALAAVGSSIRLVLRFCPHPGLEGLGFFQVNAPSVPFCAGVAAQIQEARGLKVAPQKNDLKII